MCKAFFKILQGILFKFDPPKYVKWIRSEKVWKLCLDQSSFEGVLHFMICMINWMLLCPDDSDYYWNWLIPENVIYQKWTQAFKAMEVVFYQHKHLQNICLISLQPRLWKQSQPCQNICEITTPVPGRAIHQQGKQVWRPSALASKSLQQCQIWQLLQLLLRRGHFSTWIMGISSKNLFRSFLLPSTCPPKLRQHLLSGSQNSMMRCLKSLV